MPEGEGGVDPPREIISTTPIVRARLTDQLLLSPPAELVVLCAPAGYSKTTTLKSWADVDHRPFVWVNCDRRHNDPSVFLGSIALALSELKDFSNGAISALELEAAWPERALARLGRELGTESTGFVLVIDDAHLLTSDGSVALLQGLIQVLPEGAQLAIGTRSVPPMPLGRMRANRNLVELGMSDLAMTRRESQRMLSASGLDIEARDLETIHEHTEGWPAALQLTSLALSTSSDIPAAVETFAGDDRTVVEYLHQEFLSGSTQELVDFMTRTSVLEELSGPLCDEVLGRNGSASVLGELARSNALVIPLDRRDQAYRYHHLFSEMLRADLLRNNPELIKPLHRRASLWFEAQSEPVSAVEHAIESDDLCLAGRLIWASVPELTGRGRLATLNRWLDEVGRDRLDQCHGLLLTAAHANLLAGSGEEAKSMFRRAMDLEQSPDCPVPIESDLLMLQITLAGEGVARMGSDAEQMIGQTRPDNVWYAAAHFYKGVSLHLLGDPVAAVPVLQDAARRMALTSPVMQSLALAQLAIIACRQGDLESSQRLVGEARGQVERCGLSGFPALVLVWAAEAMSRALVGQREKARNSLDAAYRMLMGLNGFLPWYEVETRLTMATASLKLAEYDAAGQLLDQARVHLAVTADAVVLSDWLAELDAQLAAATSDRESVDSPLTGAELRTLQIPADPSDLPTDRRSEPGLPEHRQDAGPLDLPQAGRRLQG